MKTYARIAAGLVVELIAAMYNDEDGVEIPIGVRFHPEIVATLVDASNVSGVAVGWTYDGTTFAAPVTPVESTTDARARALVDIRAQRAPILDALAGIGFDALASGDNATSQGAYAARQALKDITQLSAFLAATTYDDMKSAIMARYVVIVNAAPASVRVAFAALLA